MKMPAFTCAKKQEEVDLVVVSVGELGFKDVALYKDICARAAEFGLDLCPAEVGPALRLAYDDQPLGEWLYIAMEATTDSGGACSRSRTSTTGSGSSAATCIPRASCTLTSASCSRVASRRNRTSVPWVFFDPFSFALAR